MMRIGRAVLGVFLGVAAMASISCSGSSLFRQYEYEEDIYLSLDGTATIYVSSSVAALDALRGAALDTNPAARLDRDAVRRFYTSPVTRVGQVTQSRRNGRRFLHVRLDVDDIRRLSAAAPFQWARYEFNRKDDLSLYLQTLGASANRDVGDVGWKGNEAVAFRLHLPSKIAYHNAGVANFKRGNILLWEQPLTERLRGTPMVFDARMQTQSILYRTLLLFGGTVLAVAATFALVIFFVAYGSKKKGLEV